MASPEKIILIDDSETTNFLNQILIKKVDSEVPVETFMFPLDAVDFFKANSGIKNHLIFVDINMPAMDGWEVVKILEGMGIHKTNTIIMLTSSIHKDDKLRADSTESIHDFVTKPLKISILQEIFSTFFP